MWPPADSSVGVAAGATGMTVYCTGVLVNTFHGSATVHVSATTLIRLVCLCDGALGSVPYSTSLLSAARIATVGHGLGGDVTTFAGPGEMVMPLHPSNNVGHPRSHGAASTLPTTSVSFKSRPMTLLCIEDDLMEHD